MKTSLRHFLDLWAEQMGWHLLRHGIQEEDQFKEERFIFRHAAWSTQMEVCGEKLEVNVKNLGEKSGLKTHVRVSAPEW